MNIGIDANWVIFERAGVGKYSQNLIKNLLRIDNKNRYFLYFSFLRKRNERQRLIKDFIKGSKAKVTVRTIPLPAAWYEFLTSTPFPVGKLIKEELDIFFTPYASGVPKGKFIGKQPKIITTVHDLVFLRYPEHRGKKLTDYYLKRHKIALKRSVKIIAVSNTTKKDIQNLLQVPSRKIKVVYEAADERFRVLAKTKDTVRVISKYFDSKINYILSVGTLEPRKNLAKLVRAYSLLPHALQKKYFLVLVGGKGWNNSALHREINNLNLSDRVILPGFVSDEDLPYIYNKASVFVYPSLYEGFGLPVLEAMACGCPVISSNISSLPEVIGKAGVLVNSEKEEEIVKAICKILDNQKLAKKLRSKAILQARKFSWKKAAKETLKIFQKLAQ